MSIAPIGMNDAEPYYPADYDGRTAKLNKLQVEREAARLLEKQYAGEFEAWDEAKQEQFIAKTVRLIDTLEDNRAKAAFTNIVGNWLRLGKREPAAANAIGQQTNIQIHIIQAAPVPAAEVDAEFGLVTPQAGGEQDCP